MESDVVVDDGLVVRLVLRELDLDPVQRLVRGGELFRADQPGRQCRGLGLEHPAYGVQVVCTGVILEVDHEPHRCQQPQAGGVALDKSLTPLFRQIPQKAGAKPPNSAWQAMAQYNNTANFRASESVSTDLYSQAGYERRLFEATKLYAGHEDKAQTYPGAAVHHRLQGPEQGPDAYVRGLDGLGLKRYLEIQQTAYDKIPK